MFEGKAEEAMNFYPSLPQRVTGTFEVTMQPAVALDVTPGATLGRMSLDKRFYGDLGAIGKGEILTATSNTDGSAGYAAIERVSGTLHGRMDRKSIPPAG